MKHPVRAVALGLLTAALAGCTQATPDPAPFTPSPAAVEAPPTPTAAPVAAPRVTPPTDTTWPQHLAIPKLGVNASIVGHCEVLPGGQIEGPPDVNATCVVGRPDFSLAHEGVTVVGSHTFRDARVGALERIGQLAFGDTVTTGATTWTVTTVTTYPATKLPPELFEPDARRLILVTCHLTPQVIAGAPYTDTDLVVALPVS